MPKPTPQNELLKGTLDMLILKTLSVQPMHGYAIAQHIERLSGGVFAIEQGSLYPALERLQTRGLLTSKWGASPTGRRAPPPPPPPLSPGGKNRGGPPGGDWFPPGRGPGPPKGGAGGGAPFRRG